MYTASTLFMCNKHVFFLIIITVNIDFTIEKRLAFRWNGRNNRQLIQFWKGSHVQNEVKTIRDGLTEGRLIVFKPLAPSSVQIYLFYYYLSVRN